MSFECNQGNMNMFDDTGFNTLRKTGIAFGKASLKAVKTLARAIVSIIPFKAILAIFLILACIIVFNLIYFYSILDEVDSFFGSLGDGIKSLVDKPAALFAYIGSMINGLLSNNPAGGTYNHISPELMKKCMESESRLVDEEHKIIKTKARVVTKTTIINKTNGKMETSVETNESYVDYDMNVYDIKYPYRLYWQLAASMAVYLSLEGEELDSFLQTVEKEMKPQFIWEESGRYTRDVTEYTRIPDELRYDAQVGQALSDSKIIIIEKTTYYPIPALKAVITPFRIYNFQYDENIEVKNETSENIPVDGHTEETVSTGTIIVEDRVSETDSEVNPGFLEFLDDVPLSVNDFNLSLSIAERVPGSGRYVDEAQDFIDWYFGTGEDYWDMSQIAYNIDVSSMDSIGDLSAKYESNGNPSAISNSSGDPGGKSYGIWQLASRKGSVGRFLKWLKKRNSDFYTNLADARKADGGAFGNEFDECWHELGRTQTEEFSSVQEQFIKEGYYDTAVDVLKDRFGFDIEERSLALRSVLFSTSVQHGVGGASAIFARVNEKFKLNDSSDRQIINAVYDERSRVNVYFSKCSYKVRRAVYNRFVFERADALALLERDSGQGG